MTLPKKYLSLLFCFLVIASNAFATPEDFTGYTEYDPTSKITVTTNKIDVNAIDRGSDGSVYKDFGAGYFGDFEHDFRITVVDASDRLASSGFWWIGNSVSYTMTDIDNTNDGFALTTWHSGSWGSPFSGYFALHNYFAAVNDETSFKILKGETWYWTTKRDGGATTLEAFIYADPDRTDLRDTLSVTYTSTTLRYVGGYINSGNTSGYTFTVDVENLNLSPSAGGAPRRLMLN